MFIQYEGFQKPLPILIICFSLISMNMVAQYNYIDGIWMNEWQTQINESSIDAAIIVSNHKPSILDRLKELYWVETADDCLLGEIMENNTTIIPVMAASISYIENFKNVLTYVNGTHPTESLEIALETEYASLKGYEIGSAYPIVNHTSTNVTYYSVVGIFQINMGRIIEREPIIGNPNIMFADVYNLELETILHVYRYSYDIHINGHYTITYFIDNIESNLNYFNSELQTISQSEDASPEFYLFTAYHYSVSLNAEAQLSSTYSIITTWFLVITIVILGIQYERKMTSKLTHILLARGSSRKQLFVLRSSYLIASTVIGTFIGFLIGSIISSSVYSYVFYKSLIFPFFSHVRYYTIAISCIFGIIAPLVLWLLLPFNSINNGIIEHLTKISNRILVKPIAFSCLFIGLGFFVLGMSTKIESSTSYIISGTFIMGYILILPAFTLVVRYAPHIISHQSQSIFKSFFTPISTLIGVRRIESPSRSTYAAICVITLALVSNIALSSLDSFYIIGTINVNRRIIGSDFGFRIHTDNSTVIEQFTQELDNLPEVEESTEIIMVSARIAFENHLHLIGVKPPEFPKVAYTPNGLHLNETELGMKVATLDMISNGAIVSSDLAESLFISSNSTLFLEINTNVNGSQMATRVNLTVVYISNEMTNPYDAYKHLAHEYINPSQLGRDIIWTNYDYLIDALSISTQYPIILARTSESVGEIKFEEIVEKLESNWDISFSFSVGTLSAKSLNRISLDTQTGISMVSLIISSGVIATSIMVYFLTNYDERKREEAILLSLGSSPNQIFFGRAVELLLLLLASILVSILLAPATFLISANSVIGDKWNYILLVRDISLINLMIPMFTGMITGLIITLILSKWIGRQSIGEILRDVSFSRTIGAD